MFIFDFRTLFIPLLAVGALLLIFTLLKPRALETDCPKVPPTTGSRIDEEMRGHCEANGYAHLIGTATQYKGEGAQ
ncbi:hypothetical protein D9M68_553740 [compost metagenome]